ncbi:MAG: YihY/virulence factor BrkB family protein [Bacteroidota bacterium]
MQDAIDETISDIPVIGFLADKAKRVSLPKMDGLSLYHLLKMYTVGIIRGTFSTRASSIAFSFFIAIFPFLLFVLNLIPFVTFIDDFQQELLFFIEELLPPQTSSFFEDVFYDIANNPRAGLLSFVFVLSIFLMSNGVNAILTSFEFSFHTRLNRNFFRQYIVAMGVAIIIAILLLFTVISTIYLTYIIEDFKAMGMFVNDIFWISVGRYAILILMLFVGISIVYYFGTRESRKSKFFSVGSFFTTLLIILTTVLFSIYIENFASYNKLYGSIGALLILLFYIWLNSNILLLGFELNATIYRLKKRN